MSGGERPIGAAKGTQSDTEALCQTPHTPGPRGVRVGPLSRCLTSAPPPCPKCLPPTPAPGMRHRRFIPTTAKSAGGGGGAPRPTEHPCPQGPADHFPVQTQTSDATWQYRPAHFLGLYATAPSPTQRALINEQVIQKPTGHWWGTPDRPLWLSPGARGS